MAVLGSVADPDPWNPYHFPNPDPNKKMAGSGIRIRTGLNDTDPDPTKTIENIKYVTQTFYSNLNDKL